MTFNEKPAAAGATEAHAKGVGARRTVILLVCALLVAAAALVWYCLPVKRTAAVELHCDDPDAGMISAEFDFKISRSLFSPPVLDGTIRLGDTEYVTWVRQKYGFFSNLQRKAAGELDTPVFVNAANLGQGTELVISDLLYIHSIQFGDNYQLASVSLSRMSDDRGIWHGSTAEP